MGRQFVLPALLLFLCGCARSFLLVAPLPADEQAMAPRLTPYGDYPAGVLDAACAVWAPVGDICGTNGRSIEVVADRSDCPAVDLQWLGRARANTIYIHANCASFRVYAQLVSTLAHEIGHIMGLAHVADEKAVMYWAPRDAPVAVTEADVAEYRRTVLR
jgi:hypothetical protein